MIKEFDEKKNLYYAKQIIDGIPFKVEGNEDKTYTQNYLDSLKIPTPITDDDLFIRIIIDNFLNFFGKLGYLLDNEINTKKDLSYFLYYIDKAIWIKPVMTYAMAADYELFDVFLDKIGMLPDHFQLLVKNTIAVKNN